MMHSDLFGQLVNETINKAKAGDVNAAKKLMEWYRGGLTTTVIKRGVRQVVNREPSIDERILRYFGDCFADMLGGIDANEAMNIGKPANRPADPALKERDVDIAIEAIRRKKIDPKKPKTAIYDDLADEMCKSKYTIEAAAKKHMKLAENVNEVIDDLLADQ